MGWGAGEHYSLPDPGWTPRLALRDPAQVQGSPTDPSVQWCPVQPDSGGAEVRPQGGQVTVGMFVQDPLLAGSPFLRTGSRDLASPPGTVDTKSLWPWELPWAFPGVERHPASTPWGPAASASVVTPPKRPQMCPGVPTEPPRRQYEAITEHPTFC